MSDALPRSHVGPSALSAGKSASWLRWSPSPQRCTFSLKSTSRFTTSHLWSTARRRRYANTLLLLLYFAICSKIVVSVLSIHPSIVPTSTRAAPLRSSLVAMRAWDTPPSGSWLVRAHTSLWRVEARQGRARPSQTFSQSFCSRGLPPPQGPSSSWRST